MKFVVEHMVRFLVTVVAVTLVLTSIDRFFLPIMRDYFPTAFTREENYVEHSNSGPTITCTNEVFVSVGDSVDIFDSANISAQSHFGDDLIPQLASDYAKAVRDRQHVFVYKVENNNANTLCDAIDTSAEGKWVVVYLVKDNNARATSKITYIVKNTP